MAVIQFRSPVTKPLLRADQPLPADRSSVFRVTQRFTDRDFYWNDGRTHSATDIGDFGCGSPLVAMADGTAYRVKDNASQIQSGATDALGVRIDHGELEPGVRIWTEIWHMGGWTITDGQPVKAGQQIGIVGNTGLGAVCHAHVEAKRNGVKFDPEPLMFGGTLGDDDMQIPPGTQVIAQGSVPPQAALRSSPVVADDNILRRTETETQLAILWLMPGQGYYTKDGKQYRDWLAVALGEGIAYVAKEFVSNIFVTAAGQTIIPTQVASGITQAQLEAARLEGFTVGKSKAKVAVEGIKP